MGRSSFTPGVTHIKGKLPLSSRWESLKTRFFFKLESLSLPFEGSVKLLHLHLLVNEVSAPEATIALLSSQSSISVSDCCDFESTIFLTREKYDLSM